MVILCFPLKVSFDSKENSTRTLYLYIYDSGILPFFVQLASRVGAILATKNA